ncbi:MAG: 50S ribosomal protein L29 [Gammaproteobacteria bacterium]|nr:50S ribosomal protein L29 [Gammaproteobacteria bacterium]
MDASDLREFTAEELAEELEKALKEQFNMRFQRATDQLPQTHLLTQSRRNIARVKTIIREKQNG